jgi:trigger factor
MSESQRAIPEAIKREVRQRCGFGCVVCGCPLYEYEHMEEWAIVKRHVANEITLLCDRHHREKTNGLLPKEMVRKSDETPFNRVHSNSTPYKLHYSGEKCDLVLGNNYIRSSFLITPKMSGLVIEGDDVISFEYLDGEIFLNLKFYDKNGSLILGVIRNELVYRTSHWDVTFIGTTLAIRENMGRHLVEINFQPPSRITISKAYFWYRGYGVLVHPYGVIGTNTGARATNNMALDCPTALRFGPGPAGISFNVDRRGNELDKATLNEIMSNQKEYCLKNQNSENWLTIEKLEKLTESFQQRKNDK